VTFAAKRILFAVQAPQAGGVKDDDDDDDDDDNDDDDDSNGHPATIVLMPIPHIHRLCSDDDGRTSMDVRSASHPARRRHVTSRDGSVIRQLKVCVGGGGGVWEGEGVGGVCA